MQKSLKKYTVIGIIFTALAGTLAHFFYLWSGENLVVALFTPVSESTWEHLKLLFFPMIIYSIFEALVFHSRVPELFYANITGAFVGMLSIVVLFYTYSGILGNSCTPVDIGIFYLSVVFAFLSGHRLAGKRERLYRFKWLILTGLVACTIAFFFFTWNPPEIGLFQNPEPGVASVFLRI